MRTTTPRLIRTAALLSSGISRRDIGRAVAAGHLLRLRHGAFGDPELTEDYRHAARVRGRLTGTSELHHLGVFVLSRGPLHVNVPPLHVNVPPSASRLARLGRPHRISRRALLREPHPDVIAVEPLDAVFDAVLSQRPREAIATIDSALHLGVICCDELDQLFAALPRRFRRLRRLLDARAESGSETLLRLILRVLGCTSECQVEIPGVGRVDFLVDGWLIIECDSEAHHAGWEAQKTDRRRDLAAAARGYATLRVIAEDIFWHPADVREGIGGLIRGRRR